MTEDPTIDDGRAGLSPEWQAAVRAADGIAEAAEPLRFEPPDWQDLGDILTALITATFAEATAWRAEMSIVVNPPPRPGRPLDFIEIDIDGRSPWHSANATLMAPSGELSETAGAALSRFGWQGVGTGGPVYKVWDGSSLEAVAADLAAAATAVFPPECHRFWEFAVTVLAPDDATGTSYEVVASVARAVVRRALTAAREHTPDTAHPTDGVSETAWRDACANLGFDPVQLDGTD